MFVISFKNGNDNLRKKFFDEYYFQLLEIKDFHGSINNKPFLDELVKNKQEAYKKPMEIMKSRNQEIVTIKQENYQIICVIKNFINLLVLIYHDK